MAEPGIPPSDRHTNDADREQQRPPPHQTVVRVSGQVLPGARPGDQRLRLTRRMAAQRISVPVRAVYRTARHPAVVFVYGFAGFILAGASMLMLPIATQTGQGTPFLDALFTSTSAVCVTGLVVVDTGTYWSGFGQAVILLLIQLGGFGFMTSSTMLLLLLRRQVTLRERILLREALGSGGLGSVYHLARKVIVFTLLAEALGATILTVCFLGETDPPRALWWGVFHSVSAFNNAGFDLIGGFRSLTPFNQHPAILLTVAGLLIAGGISYTVVEDVMKRRGFVRLALDTKLVLVGTAALVLLGTLALLVTERSNPDTIGAMEPGIRVLNAFFHAVSPRTAGFNSVDTGRLTDNGLIVTIALMFVGGAAGSTAGGIKIQTFSLLLFAVVSAVRGTTDVEAFRRRVPVPNVLRAVAVATISMAVVFLVAFGLTSTEAQLPLLPVLFEAFSAFATVGLTTGITPEVSPGGRIILIPAMFAGRLGPLTLVLALAARERRRTYRWPQETVKIG